jgi:FAD binding domain/Berberine and berberine like
MANSAALQILRRGFDGAVHLPGDPGYNDARRPLNPSLDPRPAIVAAATSSADIQVAVLAARESDLPVAVQATGHGLHTSYAGGLMIDTSPMSSVVVDPDRRLARVGPGATWGRVIAAAAPFGLAPLSGSAPSVGVTGFTLGGGVGWLSRRHGFAADSVVRAEVVTAAGRQISASADRHADLFWALRGGGGGFGVVTELEFRLHPVTQVYAGTTYFAPDRATEALTVYRDWAAEAPDEISTAMLLARVPDADAIPAALRGRRALALRMMHAGDPADAERLIEPLRAAAGPAWVEGFRAAPYGAVAMGGTAPRHLDLLERLSDETIDFLVEATSDEGLGISTIEIRHWGGAMAKPEADAGPVGHRGVPFSVIADSTDPALVETLRAHATGGAFLNFLSDTTRTASAYAPADYRRLSEVRAAYDPDDVLRLNHRVPPREDPPRWSSRPLRRRARRPAHQQLRRQHDPAPRASAGHAPLQQLERARP